MRCGGMTEGRQTPHSRAFGLRRDGVTYSEFPWSSFRKQRYYMTTEAGKSKLTARVLAANAHFGTTFAVLVSILRPICATRSTTREALA